ncbi:TonB protein C-terminal [Hymenobacter gelipurpurascens]|uniref:TonB protein C-terminal n=1 Tax=Hymenobacter gelipurpurascens TaxID=89968 RepID=A0A212UGV7_9BACT|nr:M56 family metallopeptidase [Hymenobacter gelipurpurascens]SNC77294.1 TonB protein C-terminal [Hymenobacter gelipurpurascens]
MSLSPLLPSPTGLLSWMLLSTVLLGACWLFYRVLLRQERCFQFNSRFLLYTPWLVLALPPLLGLAGPWLASLLLTWQTLVPGTSGLLSGGVLPAVTISATGAPGPASLDMHWLLLVYGAGVLALMSGKAWQLLLLWQTARSWPTEARQGYTLAYTGGQRPVSSFGHRIFWDETLGLSADEAAQILRHEEAHIKLGHSRERLMLELARTLLWFNPFVHFYPAALELTHELLADEAALGHSEGTGAAESYTTLLARVALRQLHLELPLTHSFTQSFTLTRIRMLTSQSPVRRWKQWLLLPLSTALVLLVACEKATDPASVITKSDASLSEPPLPPPPAQEAEDTPPPPPPPVYFFVEHMPEYVGGQEKLLADIGKQVKYPASALAEKLEGRVFIRFIVAADGSLQAAQLQKGIDYEVKYPGADGQQQTTRITTPAAQAMNEAALNAVRNLPGQWKPGTQNGQPVAVFFTVPITFSLK